MGACIQLDSTDGWMDICHLLSLPFYTICVVCPSSAILVETDAVGCVVTCALVLHPNPFAPHQENGRSLCWPSDQSRHRDPPTRRKRPKTTYNGPILVTNSEIKDEWIEMNSNIILDLFDSSLIQYIGSISIEYLRKSRG